MEVSGSDFSLQSCVFPFLVTGMSLYRALIPWVGTTTRCGCRGVASSQCGTYLSGLQNSPVVVSCDWKVAGENILSWHNRIWIDLVCSWIFIRPCQGLWWSPSWRKVYHGQSRGTSDGGHGQLLPPDLIIHIRNS